ncbi:hypothetical protein ACFYO0_13580 [Streptomyces sp. NPDC006365]|uniref:hypothetical protein n=1 Tax=Streptomyces sp. NPDC006365 TaxID=3364744 RepID=UPI0036C1C50C
MTSPYATTSTTRHELALTLPWMPERTAQPQGATDRLTDLDPRAPRALPGWTRAPTTAAAPAVTSAVVGAPAAELPAWTTGRAARAERR